MTSAGTDSGQAILVVALAAVATVCLAIDAAGAERNFMLGFDDRVNPALLHAAAQGGDIEAAAALFRLRGSLLSVLDRVMVDAVAAELEGEMPEASLLWDEAGVLAKAYRRATGDDFYVPYVLRWRTAPHADKVQWQRGVDLGTEAVERSDAGDREGLETVVKEAASLWAALDDPHSEAMTLRYLESFLRTSGRDGDLERERELAARMAALWERAGLERERAVALGWVARAESRLGDQESANELHAEVQRIHEEIGDSWTLMRSLEEQAAALGWEGDYERAQPLLRRARALAADVGDTYWEGSILVTTAIHGMNTDRLALAEAALLEARHAFESVDAGTRLVDANLGAVAYLRGDGVKALRHARRFEQAARGQYDLMHVALIRSQAKEVLHDWQGAIAEWQRAKQLAEELDNLPRRMSALAGLARCHAKQGDESAARRLLHEQVKLLRRHLGHSSLTRRYRSLAEDALRLGEHEIARELLETRLQLLAVHGDDDHAEELADAHVSIGDLDLESGDLEAASAHYATVEELVSPDDADLSVPGIRFHLAAYRRATGDERGALAACRKALSNEHLLALVAEESPDPSWIREGSELTLSLLQGLAASASDAESFVDESLRVAQLTQASGLQRVLDAAELDDEAGFADFREQADVLLERLSQRRRELAAVHDSDDREQLRSAIAELEDEHDLVRRSLELRAWRGARREPDLLDLAEIRSLLREGEVLVQYFVGPELVFGWAVTPRKSRFMELCTRTDVEPRVDYLRRSLSTRRPQPAWEASAASLRDLLVTPLLDGLQPPRSLLVAPDGVLNLMPFDVVAASGGTGPPWAVSYLPALSFLRDRERKRSSRAALLVSDPVLPPTSESSPTERAAYERGGFDLGPLKHARWETRRVAASLGEATPVTMLSGADATESAVKALALERFSVLHFATHALADEQVPLRSAIVLAADPDGRNDGFLQAREIAQLELDADLVVLSGCGTALGRMVEGEGVEGLVRSFLVAGARALIVSLWNVDDRSTALLMAAFHEGLARGLGAPESLRQAKASLARRQRGRWSHPYYWAPFVLVGSPGPRSSPKG